MSENVLKNVRIVHKHDTEENWLKATNFIPKQGELIIYDVDDKYNYERMKIGDGNTLVNDLPFSNDWESLENRPFYEELSYVSYIPEQVVEFIVNSNMTSCSVSIDNVDMPWDWVEYKVTFDNIEYIGMMTDNADSAWIDINLNGGERMKIYNYGYVYINSANFAGEHSIKVEREENIIKTIDAKYLDFPAYGGEGENSICLNDK